MLHNTGREAGSVLNDSQLASIRQKVGDGSMTNLEALEAIGLLLDRLEELQYDLKETKGFLQLREQSLSRYEQEYGPIDERR